MQVIVNDLVRAVDAATTAGPDRQLHLHFAKAARSLINGATNLTISDSVANADVHDEPTTCRLEAGHQN
jgi:hypothetical protein